MIPYLRDIKAHHRVRDPLYGFIYLTDAERKIIDTAVFQRLRRVHQLALTKYVYPSAEHSRFVHSLGVMHCATLILDGVMNNKNTILSLSPASKFIKTLRFAALLHDIGHLPFSHAVERQWLTGLKHEDLSQYIISNYPDITRIMIEEGVEPQTVSSLLAKKPRAQYRLPHEIVSGQLDADRADYLLRDSHACGARYGEYDFVRFLHIFSAHEDIDDGHIVLSVDEGDVHLAESLLISRYHYNMQIPYHRTRSGFDCALRRFMRDLPEYREPFTVEDNRLSSVDFDKLEDLDDCTIMERAKVEKRKSNQWASYVLREKHLIPVVDTGTTSPEGEELFKRVVKFLRSDSAFVEDEDFFVQEQPVELIKYPQEAERDKESSGASHLSSGMIMVRTKEGKSRPSKTVDIRQRSWIFKHLTANPQSVYRIYVTPERADDVRAIVELQEQN